MRVGELEGFAYGGITTMTKGFLEKSCVVGETGIASVEDVVRVEDQGVTFVAVNLYVSLFLMCRTRTSSCPI